MKQKKYKLMSNRNLVFIIFLFVIFTFLAYRGTSSPTVQFGSTETTLTLTGPKETSIQLDYADIISAKLVSDPDYGTAADGGTSGKIQYGIWENETWGSYHSFVSSKIPCCIVLYTEDDTTVFNLENQDTTERLYTSLLEFGSIDS